MKQRHEKTQWPPIVILTYLIICALMLTTGIVHATDNATTLVVENGMPAYDLTPWLSIYKDESRTATLDDVSSTTGRSRFERNTGGVPSYGFTHAVYWFRFAIQNPDDRSKKRILELADPLTNYVDFHYTTDQQHWTYKISGQMHPQSAKEIAGAQQAIWLELPPHSTTEVFVRVQSIYALITPFHLRTQENFAHRTITATGWYALFYGLIFAMAIYSVFSGVMLRESSYYLYFGFLCCMVVNYAGINGYLALFFFPEQPALSNTVFMGSYGLLGVFSALFARKFLKLKPGGRWFPVFFRFCIGVCLLAIVVSILGQHGVGVHIVSIGSILVIGTCVTLGTLSLLQGFKPARLYLVAWSSFFVGMTFFNLLVNGLSEYSVLKMHAMQIGSALEAILLTLSLATRMRTLKEESQAAQQLAYEQQLMVADNLRRMDKVKDEFLANTSHELRTPLNGMIGLAEAVLGDPTLSLTTAQQQRLGMIVSSGQRLATLVNDILDFSKLRQHNIQLRLGVTNVSAVLHGVASLLRPLAESKGLELVCDTDDALPFAMADDARVQQVSTNLVGNAIKFTSRGRVTLSARQDAARIMITVRDTGIGIAPQHIDTIFEHFNQGDGSTERLYGGTGLGLSIARQLVRLHGGDIQVISRVGEGSSFSFDLPIATDTDTSEHSRLPRGDATTHPQRLQTELLLPEALIADGQATALPVTGMELPGGDPTAPHILLVDDEPVNLEVLRSQLANAGYRTTTCEDGHTALDQLLDEAFPRFDAVILDVMMPRLSGVDVCRRLRQRHPRGSLPVLFLTAKARPEDVAAALSAGGDDYLAKPFSRQELLARLQVHIELLRAHRVLEQQQRHLQVQQQHLIQQEKLAALGMLSAGVAHDINNPNHIARLGAQTLREKLVSLEHFIGELLEDGNDELVTVFREKFARAHEQIQLIDEGTHRIADIVTSMRSASRQDDDIPQTIDPVTGLENSIRLVSSKYKHLVRITLHADTRARVSGKMSRLNQVFMNLMVNACQAVEERHAKAGAEYQGALSVTTVLQGDRLEIRFEDNGCGMSENTLARLSTPFFTTKDAERGTGLGMSICRAIIDEHGGILEIQSEEGVGTTMTISLPVVSTANG